ncbi:argininosuccinate lyase [bacterium]|nr:MAG: argininosuccinate lyase [bacterium]
MRLWGGRFAEPPDAALWRFTVTDADRRLLGDDIRGSLAHVRMLGEVGVLSKDDTDALVAGLTDLQAEADAGAFVFLDADEDVHTAVERRLGEVIGPVSGKLHTGRSRNDQVCLDLRLYLTRAAAARAAGLEGLAAVLVDQAEAAGAATVPAFTHLQAAQLVPLGHHLLAYAWMLVRDADRFRDAAARIAVSPLGAGAAGGSSLPLDPARVAADLGLPAVFENSMDAVADRDFAAEHAFCCAQAMVHLSRLAEDAILWTTEAFGWATYADRYTTGSSALPQKKNPDIAELVRGRAAGAIGDVTALLALQKGLPLTYNRDLQEDKAMVFRADDALAGALEALAGLIATARFHPPAPSSWATALDLAEALVARGVAFREAHAAVGRLVGHLLAGGRTLAAATAADLAIADPRFEPDDLALLDPAVSVMRRRTPGGGSPASVAAQIARLRARVSGR